MKKLLVTFTALAAAYAMNSQAATTMDLDLGGSVAKNCDISNDDTNAAADLLDLDLESDAELRAYDLTISCNYIGTASVNFTSANGGFLAHDSDSDYDIPYEAAISTDGSVPSSFSDLSSPIDITAITPLGTTTYPSYIKLDPPTIVAAGSYSDTITVTIATN